MRISASPAVDRIIQSSGSADRPALGSVLLVTSWPFPHTGGVSSHLELLARELGIAEDGVVIRHHFNNTPMTLPERIAARQSAAERFCAEKWMDRHHEVYRTIVR
jgi:hypothetical protein